MVHRDGSAHELLEFYRTPKDPVRIPEDTVYRGYSIPGLLHVVQPVIRSTWRYQVIHKILGYNAIFNAFAPQARFFGGYIAPKAQFWVISFCSDTTDLVKHYRLACSAL